MASSVMVAPFSRFIPYDTPLLQQSRPPQLGKRTSPTSHLTTVPDEGAKERDAELDGIERLYDQVRDQEPPESQGTRGKQFS